MSNEVVESIALGSFTAPRAELQAALAGVVIAPLPELGVIAVDGADAEAFLQAQLTNDVAAVGADAFQLSGYCTAKGRLLATFHLWRSDSGFLLRLPLELLPAIRKRLSMFVLRSKATLTDASEAWTTWALVGPGAADQLAACGIDVPARAWSGTRSGALHVQRMPDAAPAAPRFLLAAPRGAALPGALAAREVGSGVWWWSEVDAAVPTVFAATQEKFVPQMINLEVLDGVSFKKGCYPGQEIVARSQYLGKLKRRMHRAHSGAAEPPAAGADVYQNGEAIGAVVMAASSPDGGVDLLFEAPSDRVGTAPLSTARADGPVLAVTALPYAFFDPTA